VRIDIGSATDIGRVRERNEDAVLVVPPLFAVADGMGGHRGGEVASHVALDTMEELEAAAAGSLADRVRHANRAVWDRAAGDDHLTGMGTTLTAVRLDGDTAILAHVGDSRAYLLRDGELRQLTTDHTLVERMLRSGEITEEEADVHPHKNVLTRALGTDQEVDVEELSVALQDGDRLLLCSDGLTGMVTEDQIQAILETGVEPQQAAERLVRAANRAGGVDNISVVVLAARAEGSEGGGPRRAAPRADRRTILRWALRIGVPLLVLLVLLFAARWYLDRQWYVGPSEGRVAIFQGIPLSVLGYDLGHPVQTFDDLRVTQVRRVLGERYPTFDQGIPLPSLAEAEAQVDQIREDLEEARRQARREARERDADDGGGA
jgi:PPM family protein phosphatase